MTLEHFDVTEPELLPVVEVLHVKLNDMLLMLGPTQETKPQAGASLCEQTGGSPQGSGSVSGGVTPGLTVGTEVGAAPGQAAVRPPGQGPKTAPKARKVPKKAQAQQPEEVEVDATARQVGADSEQLVAIRRQRQPARAAVSSTEQPPPPPASPQPRKRRDPLKEYRGARGAAGKRRAGRHRLSSVDDADRPDGGLSQGSGGYHSAEE